MKFSTFAVALVAVLMQTCTAQATTATVSSVDVPIAIPDNNASGITSVVSGPNLTNITDVNLIFDELIHTCIADLHVELMSPTGNAVLVKSFTENGILTGLGCPDNLIGTIIDDQAPTNLSAGTAPFTGSFNVNHVSVGASPLSVFNGEDAAGIWTLSVSDRAGADIGSLNAWSLQITGTIPEPSTLAMATLALIAMSYHRRR